MPIKRTLATVLFGGFHGISIIMFIVQTAKFKHCSFKLIANYDPVLVYGHYFPTQDNLPAQVS